MNHKAMIETGTPNSHATPYFIGRSSNVFVTAARCRRVIRVFPSATAIPHREGMSLAVGYCGGRDESV
jgi:hypothetical protein